MEPNGNFYYTIYIDVSGAEVGLCTSSWERLGNLHSRANAETQGGRTPRAGEEQGGRKRWLVSPPTGFATLAEEAQKLENRVKPGTQCLPASARHGFFEL